ncbi:MAG: DUF2779 domain-containing protein [Erysipelotrichaceae bacterium]|nr:DUF2779 domain-containing protein [Erysipelotrichaceae bacterium]
MDTRLKSKFHITDIRKYNRCHRLFSLSRKNETSRFAYYNITEDVCASVAARLGIENYVTGTTNQTNEDSLALLKQSPWLFRGRFEACDLRIKVPLMYCADGHAMLYSILLSPFVSTEEFSALRYEFEVLAKIGIAVDDMFIIHLNPDYVRRGRTDHQKLWKIADHYRENTILEHVLSLDADLEEITRQMRDFTDEEAVHGGKCSGRSRCQFYETCFPDEVITEDNSILTLVSSQYKRDMWADGIRYLKDADSSRLEGSRVQYAQIMADRNGGLYCEKALVRQWLSKNVHFPLSFLDFEWDLYPIPPFDGMKPLDVSVFQYSLHVWDGNELKHYQYVGEGDCRRTLVESMLKNLPEEGSVFAYNAKGAEKIRISEFAALYPEYAERLNAVNERLVDLADPFISGLVYDTRMRGSFTLKVIEEMVDSHHSYHDLDVSNGIEAVEIHRLLEACDDLKDRETYFEQLYKYCGLDSYSLYKVLSWLSEITEDK